jgi:hypothetical protein
LDAAEIKEGFLFRRITGLWIGASALHPFSVNRFLKDAAKKVGLGPKAVADLSGHSMRVGALEAATLRPGVLGSHCQAELATARALGIALHPTCGAPYRASVSAPCVHEALGG